MNSKIASLVPKSFPSALVQGKRAIPFKPSLLEIQTLEIHLGNFLKAHYLNLGTRYDHYYRQYTGLAVKGGPKIVRGNFFCRVRNERWKEEWAITRGGGACFFNFSFDLQTFEITAFSVNGDE